MELNIQEGPVVCASQLPLGLAFGLQVNVSAWPGKCASVSELLSCLPTRLSV
jgi:hypothetical protein